jgi:hypothetical protein
MKEQGPMTKELRPKKKQPGPEMKQLELMSKELGHQN